MPFLARELLQVSEYSKRDVPRIGGTEGGFIALVIGLVVIILGSSVAIYILLRDHSPSEREREARREERRYPSESSRLSFKPRLPWSEKLGGMFGRGTTSKRSSKSGHGWIQASGDAWEEEEADHMRSRELKRVDPPFRPPVDPYAASYSSDSVPYDPPMPASHSTLSTIRSESPIPRSMSPESTVHPSSPQQNKDRHFSVESSTSLRTFEGGTKFIEGL
ncbi:hypothetical protein C8R45DRAFT_1008966 [Mycena sanguinolenta]|nr:hypothetical protein C8R45DRAFT_1008966 [Mycena sanguinolenta]